MSNIQLNRRSALTSITAGVAAASIMSKTTFAQDKSLKGNIKQSVSKWCFNQYIKDHSLDDFVQQCAKRGLVGIDLVDPNDWPIIKKHGLVPTMVPGAGGIVNALNDKKNHKQCMEQFKKNIPLAAENNIRNVITFSGNRHGMTDYEGWDNCTEILKEAVKIAEDQGVIICMELLNSKVDHKDYMCDRTLWGVELCKRVGSPNFKLLYDIYHMQIMEGDIIRTINRYHEYIGHYHTGGNPGRKDIDTSQELYYPAIMEAIVKTGFDGYVAHEFVPKKGLESLETAIALCDV